MRNDCEKRERDVTTLRRLPNGAVRLRRPRGAGTLVRGDIDVVALASPSAFR